MQKIKQNLKNKLILCAHNILGISKCKKCQNEYKRKWYLEKSKNSVKRRNGKICIHGIRGWTNCLPCIYKRRAELRKDMKENNPEELKRRNKEKYLKEQKQILEKLQRWKFTVLSHYSKGKPKCENCGEENLTTLSINHMNGGGREHVRKIKRNIYYWIIKNNFPKDFNVLCGNCQFKELEERNKNKKRTPYNLRARGYRLTRKRKVIHHYSKETMKCAKCGISDLEVLTINHIGGGKTEEVEGKPSSFYNWLIKNNYPSGFNVLCMNCQWKDKAERGVLARLIKKQKGLKNEQE